MCQTYFRKLRVFKCLQEHIFRRGGKFLLRSSKGKAIAHRPADAQRLTGERHVRIAVIDHDCASLRDPVKQRLIRFQVDLLVVSHRKKHRRDLEQSFRQRQKRLYIRFIRLLVQHITYEKNYVRRLRLDLFKKPRIVLSKSFSMQVGDHDEADGRLHAIQRDGIRLYMDHRAADHSRDQEHKREYSRQEKYDFPNFLFHGRSSSS